MIRRLLLAVAGALVVLVGAGVGTLAAVDGASITWRSGDQNLTVGERAVLEVAVSCPPIINRDPVDDAPEPRQQVPGARVTFTITGPNAHEWGGTPDSSGIVTHVYIGEEPGDDVVVATLYCGGEHAAATGLLVVRWDVPAPPPTLQVVSAPTSAPVGSSVTVVAQLTAGDRALPGVPVSLRASMTGQPDETMPGITDQKGAVELSYTRQEPGTDLYTITATVDGQALTAGGSVVWTATPRPEIELAAPSSGPVGSDLTWTATVTDRGSPVAGVLVTFHAEMEGQEEEAVGVQADSAGRATHTHTRSAPGEDRLTVSAFVGGIPVTADGIFTWTDVDVPTIALSPVTSGGSVGEPFEWTATVTDDGAPAQGVQVTFDAEMAGQQNQGDILTTGQTGKVSFTHTRAVPGTDKLSVSAVVGGAPVNDEGERTWTAGPVPAAPVISLAPSTSAGPVGTEFVWTATVTRNGGPLSNVSVDFVGEMAGELVEGDTRTTGLDGRATYQHTRLTPGTENLSVSAEVDGSTVNDVGVRTWTEPTAFAVELTPPTSTGSVGTDFVWTATVTDGGEPVPGVEVTFLGEMPEQPDTGGPGTTGVDGRATHTHTRTTPGTEDLTVLAEVDGTRLSATGQRAWSPSAEEIPLEIVLDPRSSEGPVGSELAWTATVTSGDQPLEGARVSFRGTMDNQPHATVTGTTDADGRITGVHTRTVSGEEQLTVKVTDDSRQATDTGTRTWTTAVAVDPPEGGAPRPGPGPDLTVDRASVVPGGDVEIHGTGCEPRAPVRAEMASEVLGTSSADDEGAFTARHEVPRLPLGQYVLTVACASDVSSVPVDLVVPTWSTPAAAGGVTTAALLTFFVLLGGGIVRNLPGSELMLPGG